MKWIMMILSMTLLTGCLSLKGIATTGASTTGAVLGTAIGGPAAGAAVGIGSGLATDILIDDPSVTPEKFGGEDGQINTFWELASYATAEFFNHIVAIGIGLGALWFLAGYIGLRMRRPEEKKLEQQLSNLIDKVMDK